MVAINGTSYGYPGTIDAQQWAAAQPGFGERHWVDFASGRVNAVGSATRTVRINAGRIAGHGVFDVMTSTVDLELPNPASGTIYYTVVARRTWQATNATTIEYVTGTSARAIASGLENSPGIIADQPLALVAVTRNSNDVNVTDDLRCTGQAGNYEATSEVALTYMNEPGYRVRIAGVEWLRLRDQTWLRSANLPQSGWFNDYTPNTTGGFANNHRFYAITLGAKPFHRRVSVAAYANLGIVEWNRWRAQIELVDSGAPFTPGAGTVIASQVYGPMADAQDYPMHLTATCTVSGGDGKGIRVWITRTMGNDGINIIDTPGYAIRIDWDEITAGNQW